MPLLLLFLVVLGRLIAMNASEINHKGRSEHHHLDPERSPNRELIVTEGTFDRADGGLNGDAEMAILGLSLSTALATQSQIELLVGEVQYQGWRGFGGRGG